MSENETYQTIGKAASWTAAVLGIAYLITTSLGFLSLPSPEDPIRDPYFTLMEVLTLLIAPSMAISMLAVYFYAAPKDKLYGLAGVLFMFLMAGITSCVHFVILTVSNQAESWQIPGYDFFFSFSWPSVIYALDILAWDWFFALSMFFGAGIFYGTRLKVILRSFMLLSGLLSLAGLAGVFLQNMQIRNVGILGYAVIGPIVFGLIGAVLSQEKQSLQNAENH